MAFIYRALLVLLRRCICSSCTRRLRETRLQSMYREICRYRPRIILKDEQRRSSIQSDNKLLARIIVKLLVIERSSHSK